MKKIWVLVLLVVCGIPAAVFAAMSSTNYTIYADSVDTGDVFAAGGGYELSGTVGESPAGFSTSTSYEVRAGYQAMERGELTVSLDPETVSLGTLNTSTVASASVIARVTSDADTGYSLSVGGVSNALLDSVADGSVSAGAGEYGMAVSGADSVVGLEDVAVVSNQVLAASSTAVVDSATVLTFKASMSEATPPGTYNQTVVLQVVANF